MPGENRVRIDCPDCGAPGAAWSISPDSTEPAPDSHANCPSPAPTTDEDTTSPTTESANETQVEVTGDVDTDATVTIGGDTADEEPPSNTNECPTCGATGDEPCVTASGNEASKPHAGR